MRGLRIGLARIEHGDRADVLVVEIENGEVALQRVAAGMELPVAEVLAVAAIVAAVVGELDVLLDLRRFGLHRGDVVLEPCAGGAEKFARRSEEHTSELQSLMRTS